LRADHHRNRIRQTVHRRKLDRTIDLDVVEVHSPATGEYVGKVPMAAKADVDAAISAARRALDESPWRATSPAERAAIIGAATKLMQDRKDLFTQLIADETGAPPTIVELGFNAR
jgi:aldehyde dehydrogenase (NAD+)